jgi:hypothetical protein
MMQMKTARSNYERGDNVMKKIIKVSFLCAVIFIIVFIVICRLISQNYEYSIGRDTHKAFGNREYQILTYTSMDREKQYSLYNVKYNETIINKLNSYKAYGEYVYFCGDDGDVYIRLNTHNNKILYYRASGCDLIYIEEMRENDDIELVTSFGSIDEKDRLRFEKLLI